MKGVCNAAGEYEVESGDLQRAKAQPAPCRGCGAPVLWIRTEGGASMPLSLATARTKPDTPGIFLVLNHWADCPKAANFKKPKP